MGLLGDEMEKICPLMSAGWLSNKYAAKTNGLLGTSHLSNLVNCIEDNCMIYKDGKCGLYNGEAQLSLSILRSKEISGK